MHSRLSDLPTLPPPEPAEGLLCGSSPIMGEILDDLLTLARYDVPVLFRGESGTGKTLAARFLHQASARARGPLVELSLTMLSPGLELDRFVGHAAGAFTDAKRDLPGAVEAAHGGSLLLDEVGDAPPSCQGILLRVLEERHVQRQGEHRPRPVNVRLLLATNRDLERAVAEGTLRPDLYHRLPGQVVMLPPLRERREDIPRLADFLLARAVARYHCPPRPIGAGELDRLTAYCWPGNVRQLDRALETWLIRGRLPAELDRGSLPAPNPRVAAASRAVVRHAQNKAAAARDLGVSRTTLYRWLETAVRAEECNAEV